MEVMNDIGIDNNARCETASRNPAQIVLQQSFRLNHTIIITLPISVMFPTPTTFFVCAGSVVTKQRCFTGIIILGLSCLSRK